MPWLKSQLLAGKAAQQRQRGEIGAGRGDAADGQVDGDPALPGPVDVLQVEQQGELVHHQSQPGTVGERRRRVPPVLLGTPDRDPAHAGEQSDAPHVVMQVLAADAHVPERSLAVLDAVGDAADRPEGCGERQPADQRGLLTWVEFLVKCVQDVHALAPTPERACHPARVVVPLVVTSELGDVKVTDEVIARTKQGSLRGVSDGDALRFLGIPFAQSPATAGRFAAPVPHPGWDGVRDALDYGATSPQPDRGITIIPEPIIPGDNELNLNVFTPDLGTANLPVFVWIHGGGYFGGCSASPWYRGGPFARDGVVLVSVNYRLGAEGFLEAP